MVSRLVRLLFCSALVACVAPSEAGEAPAAPESPSSAELAAFAKDLRPQDSVWLISTRHLGSPDVSAQQAAEPRISRYVPELGWQLQTMADLKAVSQLTVVYVHGNREDADRAERRGVATYSTLLHAAVAPPPFRFVIWSWPSDRLRRTRSDVLCKAARSDDDSYYLAQFISQLEPQTHVGMFGFSYGSRIITGALHLLGAGTLNGRQLPGAQPSAAGSTGRVRSIRVALAASAMHDYWLLPGHAHGRAISQVERMLVLINGCDEALRFYPLIDRCERPQALGYTGFSWTAELGAAAARLDQQDVTSVIGRAHDYRSYLGADSVMAQVRPYLFW